MHCHPWNTPPFEEALSRSNSMLCNLPKQLIQRKLESLHVKIVEAVGIVPKSFRAGRWAFSSDVAANIHALGYKVDSSVCPGVSWNSDAGPDYTNAPLWPYPFWPDDVQRPSADGPLMEIQPSIGFWQAGWERRSRVRQYILNQPVAKGLRLLGVLDRLHLLNFRWLSPELSSAADMIRLGQRLMENRAPVLNMTFHSNSLVPGFSPFVRTERDREAFLQKIEVFLDFVTQAGIRFATLAASMESSDTV
jgi:hypothetical protein